jgi:gluconate 2-dehydrogenase gamma chain
MADDQPRIISRRELLKGAAVVGAAAVAGDAGATVAEPAPHGSAALGTAAMQRAPAARVPVKHENLTAVEADLLEAIVDHLIPSDENGPGAIEAGSIQYIDRALGGALSASREAYRAGLEAFERYCRMSRGAPFLQLSKTDQISVLIDVETGAATGSGAGFAGSSAAFFNLIRSHTIQGMFGDPFYGGNVNFAGWDLIGYPGVRTMVTAADQQRLEKGELKPNHRSAYEYGGFNKATVRAGSHGEVSHGD